MFNGTKVKAFAKKVKKTGLAEYPLRFGEWLLFGGKTVETILIKMLRLHYKSRFRREWLWSKESPHFTNFRSVGFEFIFGKTTTGTSGLYRGFLSSEVIKPGERLLDIGCGDGFFSNHFFSPHCSTIDAVDIEPTAIAAAKRYNSAPNINFHLMDAVNLPFPSAQYDVVVWDGAIGHFPGETTEQMLKKITRALSPEGVFTGSESLGLEGHDHLQFFESVEDLDRIFKKHFAFRGYREAEYKMNIGADSKRREAYWRCSNSEDRIVKAGWKIFK